MEFQGVQFTEAQSNALIAEQANIDSLINQMNGAKDGYNYYITLVDDAIARRAACSGYQKQKCIEDADASWNYAASNRDERERTFSDIQNVRLPIAKTRYNDVLDGIQNQIKLSIQASNTNTQSQTQLSQNALTLAQQTGNAAVQLAQNDPLVAIEKAKQKAIVDKAKTDNKNKNILAVGLSLAAIVVAFLLIKKFL